MPSRRRIALLIESSRSYGRGLLRGIGEYARTRGQWSLRHQEMMIDAAIPAWLHNWQGDGIIARITSPELADVLQQLKLPTVDVRCWQHVPDIPWVGTDDREIVRLAIEHLLDRGLQHLAFCGFQGANYSVERLACFRQFAAEQGFDAHAYESPGPEQPTTSDAELSGMLDEPGVIAWLAQLPRPLGLVACNDIRAQQVLLACQTAGLSVPDEVAVVGIDNDDVVCPLSDPQLSSVELGTEQIGYEAAALLDRMLSGEAAPTKPITLAPRRVVVRRSSEVWASADETTDQAYRLIRDRACDGITVAEVVEACGISRRVLERRMAEHYGQSPHQLIREFRLQRAKQLLEDTDLSIQEVAPLAGFEYVENMNVTFKRQTGVPPGRYREKQRRDRLRLNGSGD